MTAPLYEVVARRFAGRHITLNDITDALDVNETVARSIIADLKVMKLAKSAGQTYPTTWAISPPVCLDAMRLDTPAAKREAVE